MEGTSARQLGKAVSLSSWSTSGDRMHSVIDWKCRPEVRKYQKLVHGDGAGKSVLLGLDTIPLHQHVC